MMSISVCLENTFIYKKKQKNKNRKTNANSSSQCHIVCDDRMQDILAIFFRNQLKLELRKIRGE